MGYLAILMKRNVTYCSHAPKPSTSLDLKYQDEGNREGLLLGNEYSSKI